MTDSWIVGIDGSEPAAAALRWAVVNAPSSAKVTALCAYHVPFTLSMLAARRGFDVDRLGMEAEAHHLLDEAVASVGVDPAEVDTLAVEGHPAGELIEAAEDASLLVLGRRGHGRLHDLVLGSTSNYCATHADRPVAVVPPEWDGGRFTSVVVGFDGSPNAEAALRWALETAPDDVKVELLIAIEPAPWLDEDITLARFPDEVRAEEKRITAVADAVDPDHRARRNVLLHGPRQALAEAAGAADLIVVGARGHGRVGAALLGSVCTWLLHNAPCPVVIVPRSDPS